MSCLEEHPSASHPRLSWRWNTPGALRSSAEKWHGRPCMAAAFQYGNISGDFDGQSSMYMGVSKNRGTPKWMVYRKILLKWMIWGYPYFWKHPYIPSRNTHHSRGNLCAPLTRRKTCNPWYLAGVLGWDSWGFFQHTHVIVLVGLT